MVQNVLRNFTQAFGGEWMTLMCLFQSQRECATRELQRGLCPEVCCGGSTHPWPANPKQIPFQGMLRSRMMLLLTFPPCKQWLCNFNLLCFVGSSRDNSLKFGMWEFMQPGMWHHDYASTQGRRGEAPLLSLGACSHLWEHRLIFSSQQNQE